MFKPILTASKIESEIATMIFLFYSQSALAFVIEFSRSKLAQTVLSATALYPPVPKSESGSKTGYLAMNVFRVATSLMANCVSDIGISRPKRDHNS